MPAFAKSFVAGTTSSVVVPATCCMKLKRLEFVSQEARTKWPQLNFTCHNRVHCYCKLSRYNIAIKRSASGAPACVLSLQRASYRYTRGGLLSVPASRPRNMFPVPALELETSTDCVTFPLMQYNWKGLSLPLFSFCINFVFIFFFPFKITKTCVIDLAA